jgi:hypothetical protein
MDILNGILIRYGAAIRVAWIVLLLLLAACNNGDEGGGGGPGY